MSSIVNKIKQTVSHNEPATSTTQTHSHNETATPSHSSAGDRAADIVEPHSTRSNNIADSAASSRTPTTATTGTGAGVEGKVDRGVERGAEHLREHAQPPRHHHNQPKEDGLLSEATAASAAHDHQHLAPVTHETRHRHEVEEVERQREVDRHVHHVQHHTQPVLDTQHASEEHHQKTVPVTNIRENHVATDEDKAQFAALNTARDSVIDAGKEKTIIDRGERVLENTSHHVHHVVQPVIERDTHEHIREHTTVPIHHEVHEAPVVHQSTQHQPLSMNEFTQGGGLLNSTLKHGADLLHVNGKECERTVDGPAETLAANLGLSSGSANTSSVTPSTTGSSAAPTSAAGTTGGRI